MGKTLRQRIRALKRSEDEKTLISEGFVYPSGALTKEGRKVVLDHLFHSDPELKQSIIDIATDLRNSKKKDS